MQCKADCAWFGGVQESVVAAEMKYLELKRELTEQKLKFERLIEDKGMRFFLFASKYLKRLTVV